VAFQSAGGTFAAPTDSKNNTWTALTPQVFGTETIGIYYVFNPTVGPGHTFTCNSTNGHLFISAWSGTLTTSGVFDAQNGFSTTNFLSAVQPGSVTPAQTGELLVTSIVTESNDTEAIDSSFKIQDSQYSFSDFAAWAYLVDLGSSAVNPTWTPSGATPGAAVIAAFKPGSGGGGGTAPSITSANSTTFTVGTAGSFTVTTTGAPTPSLTETGALPGGVTFVNNGNGTATLSGTPAAGTAGSYPITITASNGVGAPANQSFTLTVN
jgi:hypothetical protein